MLSNVSQIKLDSFQKRFCSKLSLLLLTITIKWNVDADGTIRNPIRFPTGEAGPFVGLFVAISVPLTLPNKNVFLSYNFEANYNLPQNQTTYEYPPLLSDRSFGISRKSVYSALEYKIKSHGYPGKECLLRTICESAQTEVDSVNGVLGDILHVILTPSKSQNPQLQSKYLEAEKYGKLKKQCKKYEKMCSISFLQLITWLSDAFIK